MDEGLKKIAHDLWYEGGRLRINLMDSLAMHPENWHEEGLNQRIAAWDVAAESYFNAVLGRKAEINPTPLASKDKEGK